MLPVGVRKKRARKEKYTKDEFPVRKFDTHDIRRVRKVRLEMNKDFEKLIHKLKTQYWDNRRGEYDEIKILEHGVFSSVMEKEIFFDMYKDILFSCSTKN